MDVKDDPSESRYVVYVDGELAGFSEYEIDERRARIVFTHTRSTTPSRAAASAARWCAEPSTTYAAGGCGWCRGARS